MVKFLPLHSQLQADKAAPQGTFWIVVVEDGKLKARFSVVTGAIDKCSRCETLVLLCNEKLGIVG